MFKGINVRYFHFYHALKGEVHILKQANPLHVCTHAVMAIM